VKSGHLKNAPGEKWANIDAALTRGTRGLPRGYSLSQLLGDKRGVRNQGRLPKLSIAQILTWADAHHRAKGSWPTSESGTLLDAPDEKWRNIQNALVLGLRGLPGGSSLAKLLGDKRNVK